MCAITDRLETLAKGPKPWRVTVTFQDGRTHVLDCPFEGGARNAADRYSRKIGKDLISRDTGEIVRIVSVNVEG